MAWVSGQKLQGGKYTIEQELGKGGFGITYRARDNNGRQVVIKTLNEIVQSRPDFAKFQQDFLNEALRLAKCSHPHIVRVDEVIQEGALWCMVMEYIDGEDLATRIENQGALPEVEALKYIQQIGEALTVVHNNSLLHRDIKPQNIMVRSGQSEAVLIDFGIAREFTQNLTQTHTQTLTPAFAPIEQYDKRAKRGAYTDIYALAATLYFLLTGELPAPAPVRTMIKLVEPKQLNSQISDRVNWAIIKGMEIKPEDRPQSMQEWLALLGIDFAPTTNPHRNPDELVSSVGMNYKKLRDLLAAKKWLEADQETAAVILKVSRGGKEGSLKPEHLEKFPSQDLQTIDKLWGKYSNGRFGFSVQKRIWQSVGGTKDSDYSIFRRFAIRVGWLVKEGGLLGWFGDQWVDKEASQLNFANRFSSEKYIPEGYFPCSVLLWCGEGTFSVWPEPGRSLLSRRDL
jgi:serine/threonine protein kinase